jgi:hypothetical protein
MGADHVLKWSARAGCAPTVPWNGQRAGKSIWLKRKMDMNRRSEYHGLSRLDYRVIMIVYIL